MATTLLQSVRQVRKILLLLLLLLLVGACAPAPSAPEIALAYSPRLDAACSVIRGGRIDEAWKRELAERKPELERLWRESGPQLIGATEAITGKPFPARHFKVRLTLCNLPSQSMLGTSVNMRFALASFTDKPVSLRYKVDTLFHELLHEYLAANPVDRSPLLERHAAEPQRTREHLHLFALQKAVLLEVGARDELADVIAIDSQLPGGFYRRAWEIVNASEDRYLDYVAEMKQ